MVWKMIKIIKKINKISIYSIYLILLIINFANIIFMNNYNIIYANNDNMTSAKAMVVMDISSNRVLYSKNMYEKLPMASTTKIITAIVAIENNNDLDRVIIIDKDSTKIEGTSIYLQENETLSLRELLYGLMLRSGNDAAVAIAKATSGSVDEFIAKCNEFCEKIGAKNTNLVNPHGLPNDNHYTTAYDLGLISSYALNNEEFAKIVSTKQKTVSNVLNNANNRVLYNKNKLLKNMDDATGVKTGYTRSAGRCFVGSAKRDNLHLVCVVLNCNNMFEESQRLLENGFNEFKMVDLLDANSIVGNVKLIGANKENVNVFTRNGVSLPLKVSEVDSVQIMYDIPDKINLPVTISDPVGKINIYINNNLIFSDNLYIIESVESKDNNASENIMRDFVHLD